MKRYQPYYIPEKLGNLEHHFRVGLVADDSNVIYCSWDGQKLTRTGGWFGSPGSCPTPKQMDVPEKLKDVIPFLKQIYLEEMSKNRKYDQSRLRKLGICYDGYYARSRFSRLVILDHDEISPDHPHYHTTPIKSWNNLIDDTVTVSIDENGKCRIIEGTFGGSTYTYFREPPTQVYDYFQELHQPGPVLGKNVDKNFTQANSFTDPTRREIKDLELIQVILNRRILSFDEFHAKYHLAPDVPFSIFGKN
jgi:hypothetical protein